MENQINSGLFGRNIFTDAFRTFNEEAFFQNLHFRVKNKSYFAKYKGFKTTLLWLSYLFNVASGATACYAVYWLTKWLTGFEVVAWIIAIIFLFFLEKVKRKSSTEFWQILFFNQKVAAGWLALSLFCFAISLASSAFGVKEGTENMGPGANLIAIDSTARAYNEQIAKLEAENLKLEKQRNHLDEIYWPAQLEKETNKELIALLQTKVVELNTKIEGKNDKLTEDYQSDLVLTAWTLVWITIAMELLFELCIAYLWYYYYRSYVERRMVRGLPKGNEATNAKPASPPPRNPSLQKLQLELQSIAQQITELEKQTPLPENGETKNEVDPLQITPIGFFTQEQRMEMGLDLPDDPKPCVHMCTHVYTAKNDEAEPGLQVQLPAHDDLYTVPHYYRRWERTCMTPYTENQMLARISQYERIIAKARQKQSGEEVLENRTNWLSYWKEKLTELYAKQKEAGIRDG